MYKVDEDTFQQICEQGYASIPKHFRDQMTNVVVCIEDNPSPQQVQNLEKGTAADNKLLLGLYSGIALTRRAEGYGHAQNPDMISIFKNNHELVCNSMDELIERVRQTIVHEVGHYFGMDEDQLREMGYGSA